MIKCNKIIPELEAYRKGLVSAELKIQIEEHLSGCNACRNELNSLKQLDTLLDIYQIPALAGDFEAKFHNRLAEEQTRAPQYAYRFRFNWRKVGLVVSAAIVLITITLLTLNPFNSTSPAIENEIINNLDLLENMAQKDITSEGIPLEMQTTDVIDLVENYELVEAMPEIMDVDLNGQ